MCPRVREPWGDRLTRAPVLVPTRRVYPATSSAQEARCSSSSSTSERTHGFGGAPGGSITYSSRATTRCSALYCPALLRSCLAPLLCLAPFLPRSSLVPGTDVSYALSLSRVCASALRARAFGAVAAVLWRRPLPPPSHATAVLRSGRMQPLRGSKAPNLPHSFWATWTIHGHAAQSRAEPIVCECQRARRRDARERRMVLLAAQRRCGATIRTFKPLESRLNAPVEALAYAPHKPGGQCARAPKETDP